MLCLSLCSQTVYYGSPFLPLNKKNKKMVIVSFYLTILTFFPCNCKFTFRNSEFFSQNCPNTKYKFTIASYKVRIARYKLTS